MGRNERYGTALSRGEVKMSFNEADRIAIDKLLAVEPAWTGMRRADEALALGDHVLLHAGPPAEGGADGLCTPIRNAAAVACVFEGWANDLDEGEALVRSGRIRFEPAQDRNVATPMAAVVSRSMWLIEVGDLAEPTRKAFGPINGGGHGGFPAARYGRRVPESVDHLRWINGAVAEQLVAAATEPLALLPIVDRALTEGDDAHLRHVASAAQLVEALRARLGPGFAGGKIDAFIAEWPIFFLAYWMAAVRCLLDAPRGVAGSSLCTAFGGNGTQFGLQIAGLPDRWFTAPGSPPLGKLRAPHTPETCVGAIGDSALVEAFGLGAMAQSYCPAMQDLHQGFSPPDLHDLPASLVCAVHPRMTASGARVGIAARRIVETATTPVIELGIIDAEAIEGGLGAGIYRPPLSVFSEAVEALDQGV